MKLYAIMKLFIAAKYFMVDLSQGRPLSSVLMGAFFLIFAILYLHRAFNRSSHRHYRKY